MPIPTPTSSQTHDEYVWGVCVPFLEDEGYERNQAIAICERTWNENKGTQLIYPKGYKPRQWATIDRRRAGFRRKFRPKIGDALDEHVQQMFDVVGNTTDLNNLPQYIRQKNLRSDMIEKVFKDLYITVGSEFAKFDRRQAKKRAGIDIIEKANEDEVYATIIEREMQKYIEDHVGMKIATVSGTSKDIIIRKLEQLIPDILDRGVSSSEAQTMLRDELDNEWLRAKRYRTERIVRTETTPASMVGSMKGVKSTGIDHYKIWSAAFQDTRTWHSDASGQKVGMDEDFMVMGEAMQHPGDPRVHISAENVINCNCALTYETK